MSLTQGAVESGTHHSFGGMIFTIPDFMPYLSTLSTNFLKLRNWSMVCNTIQLAPHITQLHIIQSFSLCASVAAQ